MVQCFHGCFSSSHFDATEVGWSLCKYIAVPRLSVDMKDLKMCFFYMNLQTVFRFEDILALVAFVGMTLAARGNQG